MKPVGYFDEDDAYVVAHGQQELFEGFRLCGSLVAEDSSRYFGQAVDNHGYFGAEDVRDVFYRIIGVFHHIVQEGRTDGGGA